MITWMDTFLPAVAIYLALVILFSFAIYFWWKYRRLAHLLKQTSENLQAYYTSATRSECYAQERMALGNDPQSSLNRELWAGHILAYHNAAELLGVSLVGPEKNEPGGEIPHSTTRK